MSREFFELHDPSIGHRGPDPLVDNRVRHVVRLWPNSMRPQAWGTAAWHTAERARVPWEVGQGGGTGLSIGSGHRLGSNASAGCALYCALFPDLIKALLQI